MTDNGLQIIRYSPFQPMNKSASSWFDLRVFYVRISNFKVDDTAPGFLTLNHIPLSPYTSLEVNGARIGSYSDGISSLLRRARVDKKSEEATFVSTDSIRFTGSVKFEVFDKDDLVLSGVLEMSKPNRGELKNKMKKWSMNCESNITTATGFLKGKTFAGPGFALPTIEVYIAGCFSEIPIIFNKKLQLSSKKKHTRKSKLDSIPEHDTTELPKDATPALDLQVAEYRESKKEYEEEEDYSNMYWSRTEYMDGEEEDGALSWFNAGVRVGVGIGLGVCLGVGIGVGLLVRSYQTTTRTFKRRLL